MSHTTEHVGHWEDLETWLSIATDSLLPKAAETRRHQTQDIYIYIYAFSRRFYPKQLTLHLSYSFTFYQLLLSLGIEPMILALLAPCSTI